jgi:hypothetical protein
MPVPNVAVPLARTCSEDPERPSCRNVHGAEQLLQAYFLSANSAGVTHQNWVQSKLSSTFLSQKGANLRAGLRAVLKRQL